MLAGTPVYTQAGAQGSRPDDATTIHVLDRSYIQDNSAPSCSNMLPIASMLGAEHRVPHKRALPLRY